MKLTDYGKEIYPYVMDREPDENGYYEFQLWDLMNIYGEHINMIGKLPFETDILIPEENLR